MGLFDILQGNLDAIAGKIGMTPEQVKSITDTLQAKLIAGATSHVSALEATAAQHGVSVDQIQQLLTHGGVADQLEVYAKGLLKS